MRPVAPPARTLLTAICLMLLTSCAMIPQPHEIPWSDRVYLHDDPVPGDFAVHRHEDGDYDNRWQVEKVEGDKVEVSLRVDVYVMGVSLDYTQHFVVDRDGTVLDAWVRYDDGRIESRPVASRGQQGGLQDLRRVMVSPGYRIVTSAGAFNIDEGFGYTIVIDLGLGKTRAVRIDYLTADVPFRRVRTLDQGSFDSGVLLDLMQNVAFAGSAQLNSASARLFEQTLADNMDSFDIIELHSFGRGAR